MSSRYDANPLGAEMPIAYELVDLDEIDPASDRLSSIWRVFGDPLPVEEVAHRDLHATPLVIVGYDGRLVRQMLQEQRASTRHYLRPVAVIGLDSAVVEEGDIAHLADAVVGARDGRGPLQAARKTLAETAAILDRFAPAGEDRPMAMLQYALSRRVEFEPVLDPDASMAYRFPLVESILDVPSEEAMDILNDLAEHGLMNRHVIDRLFLCPDCGGYRVPVKELCPECLSPNVALQDSIHHFQCGYVGPEREFIGSGRPICPKCNDQLRHIGVEYNRPGRILACQECGNWASEPELRAWCVDCNAYHQPEDLRTIRVHRYGLSRTAVDVARSGRWSQIQATYVGADVEPRPVAAAAVPDNREAMQMLLTIAVENQWPVTVYKANLLTRVGESRSPEEQGRIADRAETLLNKCFGPKDLVVRVSPNAFLITATRSGRQGDPPKASELQSTLGEQAGLRIKITEVEPRKAVGLLSDPG